MTLIGAASGIVRRVRYRRAVTLCGYLGCGTVASRLAYDNLYNRRPACPDAAHGKETPR